MTSRRNPPSTTPPGSGDNASWVEFAAPPVPRADSREITGMSGGMSGERRDSNASLMRPGSRRDVEQEGRRRASTSISHASSHRSLEASRKRGVEERVGSQIDLMFVFPCPSHQEDIEQAAKPLRPSLGSSWASSAQPLRPQASMSDLSVSGGSWEWTPYSAAWYLKQVCKADFTTAEMRRGSFNMVMTNSYSNNKIKKAEGDYDAQDADDDVELPPSASGSPSDREGRRLYSSPAMSGEDSYGGREPDLTALLSAAREADTMQELQRRVADLFVGYILSRHCGCQAKVFTGADGRELFVAISASEAILRAHADMLDVQLQLDTDVARKLLGGQVSCSEVVPPFVKYDVDEEEHLNNKLQGSPFRLYNATYAQGSVFTDTDRIRIIMAVIKKAFHVDGMIESGFLNCWYPVHNQKGLLQLAPSWTVACPNIHGSADHDDEASDLQSGWRIESFVTPTVSMDTVFRYFGAKLAFNVAYIRYLLRQTLPLAVLTPMLFLVPQAHSFEADMCVGFILIIWAATIEEFWKRTENRLKMQWGVETFSAAESVRHQFRGTWSKSPVDRSTMVKVDPDTYRVCRFILTSIANALYMTLVVCTSLYLYNKHSVFEMRGKTRLATLINITIALLLVVYNSLWDWLAVKLTVFENHRTDADHNEALLLCVFRCRFITSFLSLFYIAFIQDFVVEHQRGSEKIGQISQAGSIKVVREQLHFFFLINILYHWVAMAMPFLTHRIGLWWEGGTIALQHLCCWPPSNNSNNMTYSPVTTSGPSTSDVSTEENRHATRQRRNRTKTKLQTLLGESPSVAKSRSYPEAQSRLPEYTMIDEIADRMDIIVELGYVLFFGLIAPEVILLFMLSTMLRLHSLGWKLVHTMRRPFPFSAAGLGVVFEHVQVVMSQAAVACNILLILLSNASRPPKDDLFLTLRGILTTPDPSRDRLHDYKATLSIFTVLYSSILLIRYLIDCIIPDTPSDVLLHQQRQKAVADRLQKMVVEDMKRWEGKELERAYGLVPAKLKQPYVLSPAHVWVTVPAGVEGLVSHGYANRPWSPKDQGFEECEMF